MRKIVLDVENSTTKLNDKYNDFSPYCPTNKLVSIGWMVMEDGKLGEVNYTFCYHNELSKFDSIKLMEDNINFNLDLKSCTHVIAHNAKYDLQWLEESGFDCSHLEIECTQIREYVMARGRSDFSFRLADTCKRYKVAEKGELFDKYPDTTIDQMPIGEVEEYGRADIQACAELYLAQEKRLSQDSYVGLRKTIDMTNDFCRVLIDIERAGVKIDENALKEVETQFTAEAEQLKYDLNVMVRNYMGDTIVNLDSPQQLSEVIYSRRIKPGQEANWLQVFNIGKDDRGKFLRRPKLSFPEFRSHIKNMCETVMKTEVHKCDACNSVGTFNKIKKDGSPWKNPTRCKTCNGKGHVYKEINEIAGLKMQPSNIMFTTVDGFTTSKTFMAELIDKAMEKKNYDAVEFLTKVMRLSAVSSYLSTFVGSIQTLTQANGMLHANFNQTITATGRLSSTKPNLQNMPRENTFPIRKVFVSRFEGGSIVDTDFAQLEFAAAVHLARDENGKRDILGGKDVHIQTRDIITANGMPIDRQQAKSRTFKPLFAGTAGAEAEQIYYRAFLTTLYPDIGKWHNKLQEEAIKYKIITVETGRQYSFPNVERSWSGGATFKTQICNYEVQGFATGDLSPIATIRLHNEMKKLKLKSVIILVVHDSVIIDAHPDELDIVIKLAKQLGKFAEEEMLSFYGIEMFIPIKNETKVGKDAMNLVKVA